MENKIKKTVMEEARKRGLMVEQEEKTNSDFVEMISILLHSQTQAHTYHLQSTSYAEHKALQTYYEGIDGLVDTIVEAYQGKYGIVKGYKTMSFNDYKGNESTIGYFQKLCDKVTELRDCCEDSWLQNEIDNVCTLLNQTLYKLKFLK
jgi:hypothetical protein